MLAKDRLPLSITTSRLWIYNASKGCVKGCGRAAEFYPAFLADTGKLEFNNALLQWPPPQLK